MNDGDTLRKIAEENSKETKEKYTYTLEEIYNNVIYPLLAASAAKGERNFFMYNRELKDIIPNDTSILELKRYIQNEKNIRIHSYGDIISFFW